MSKQRRLARGVADANLPAVLRWPVAHAIVLVLFVLGSSVGWLAIRRFQSVPHNVERTLREQNSTLTIHNQLHELDGLARNYAATGDSALRSRFDELAGQLQEIERDAATWGREGSSYAGEMLKVAALAVGWLETFARPSVVLAGAAARARAVDTLAAGDSTFELITTQLDELGKLQQANFAELSAAASRLSEFGLPFLLGATVVALLLALAAVTVLDRVTERAVRRRTELALVLDAMPYGFAEVDHDLRIQRMSWRAAEMFGVERRGLQNVAITSLFCDEDRETVAAHLRGMGARPLGKRDTILGRPPDEVGAEIEVKVGHSDGTLKTIVLIGTPLPPPSQGTAVVLRDITETRAAQEQLQQQDKLATIGTLAASVAHELNNPLAAIATFTHTIDTKKLSEEDADAVQTIADEARRAGGIVRNLLGFSRQTQSERNRVELAPIIQRVIELRRYELNRSGIAIEVDCPQDLPVVFADGHQVQQVVLNLVVNAHHAMIAVGGDSHSLTVRVRGAVDAGVMIVVEDTGPGIPLDVLPRLFEPFFTTKPEGVGTGLGLSVSQGIVSEHEGRIWAENREEGGARFVVELPAIESSDVDAGPETGHQMVDIGSRRILIVDDDAANRRALERVLNRLGHTVVVADGGASALERMRETEFEIVISDLNMPGMSGSELFQTVSSERPELARRFLFLSGDTVSQEARSFLEAAGQPALRKPYELEELHQMLARVVVGSVRARASSGYWSIVT